MFLFGPSATIVISASCHEKRKLLFCKKGTSCHQKDVFVGLYVTNMPSFLVYEVLEI